VSWRLSEVVVSAEDIQLGVRASQEGKYEDAISSLTRVIESGVKTDVVLYHLARSLFKAERFSESVRYWEDLLEHHSDVVIQINLASARYMAVRPEAEQGRYRQAIEFLKKYCEHYRKEEKAKSIIRQLEELAGDAETVREHLTAADTYIKAGRWLKASDEFLVLMNKISNWK